MGLQTTVKLLLTVKLLSVMVVVVWPTTLRGLLVVSIECKCFTKLQCTTDMAAPESIRKLIGMSPIILLMQ